MKREHLLGALLASAVISVGSTSFAKDHESKKDGGHFCQNNSCKGKSACGGHGNDNGCHGTNECKGKGWLKAKDEKACKKAGGLWKKSEVGTSEEAES